MKFLTIVFALSFTLSSFAEDKGPNEFFNLLKSKFETGTLPRDNMSSGWFTGRCIFPYAEKPTNALLVLENKLPNDYGPIYQKSEKRGFGSQIITNETKPANYFDDLAYNTNLILETSALLKRSERFYLQERDNEFSVDIRPNYTWYRIRENNGLFILENHIPEAFYCYFFNRVLL